MLKSDQVASTSLRAALRQAIAGAGVILVWGVGSCQHPPPAEPAVPATSAAPAVPRPAPAGAAAWAPHYLPSCSFIDLGDGRIGAVVAGRRIAITQGETSLIDTTPLTHLGGPCRIPDVLGGGWLFLGRGAARWAEHFDAPLHLVAEFHWGDARIGVGHAQLFINAPPDPPALYSLPGGKRLALPVEGVVDLFGSPEGVVAVLNGNGEVFVSTSEGAPFQKLPTEGIEYLAYDGVGILARSRDRTERIDAEGRLSRPTEVGPVVDSVNTFAFSDLRPAHLRPRRPCSVADRLLGGLTVTLGADRALAVSGADLLVLDAKTGAVETTHPGVFAGHHNCFPLRGGLPAFIGCNDQQRMALFRIDTPASRPVLERTIEGVYTMHFGDAGADAPLALARRCNGQEHPGALCIRRRDGTWVDLPIPADPEGLTTRTHHAVPVSSVDGSVYSFVWLEGSVDLVIVDPLGGRVRRIERGSLPESTVRLDSLTTEDGTLRLLVSGETPGVLEIRTDDTIQFRQLRGRLSNFGERAVLITEHQELRETFDGGATFHDVSPPPGGMPGGESFRCVATGCSFGPWHRVGWGPG